MTREEKLYNSKVSRWLREGRAGQFVAISGDRVVGFSPLRDELPEGAAIFIVKLPTAGSWSSDLELSEYFYSQGIARRPRV